MLHSRTFFCAAGGESLLQTSKRVNLGDGEGELDTLHASFFLEKQNLMNG